MKVRDTSQGRMYAVSSEIGCTAINGAMAVDIPAGGQSVILALDKKLIIDGDDNAKFVEVRWGTNAAVGSSPAPSWIGDVVDGLGSIVGADKFDINYIPAERKLVVYTDRADDTQLGSVTSLLEQVVPQNVEAETVNKDFRIPTSYRQVEYLESTDYWKRVRINYEPVDDMWFRWEQITTANAGSQCSLILPWENRTNGYHAYIYITEGYQRGNVRLGSDSNYFDANNTEKQLIELNVDRLTVSVNGEQHSLQGYNKATLMSEVWIFGDAGGYGLKGRIYFLEIGTGDENVSHLVPCVDETGAPCMFDAVSQQAFYNSGRGDFIYPTESTTYSLRRALPDWGKLTEHGLRRLYHVPAGYKGELIDYAEQNGYKPIVEPEMPEEGYWEPVWHDREDCIELEWVETEPPVEEELQIEEIENA